MFSFFESIVSPAPVVSLIQGFKTEAPIIQEKREAAMRKMKEINRPSLLEGGHFSRNNTVLTGG